MNIDLLHFQVPVKDMHIGWLSMHVSIKDMNIDLLHLQVPSKDMHIGLLPMRVSILAYHEGNLQNYIAFHQLNVLILVQKMDKPYSNVLKLKSHIRM